MEVSDVWKMKDMKVELSQYKEIVAELIFEKVAFACLVICRVFINNALRWKGTIKRPALACNACLK